MCMRIEKRAKKLSWTSTITHKMYAHEMHQRCMENPYVAYAITRFFFSVQLFVNLTGFKELERAGWTKFLY